MKSPSGLLFILFFSLLIFVSVFPVLGIDVFISRTIQSIHFPFFQILMSDVSYLGDSLLFEVLIALTVFVQMFVGWRIEALLTLADIISGTILGILFKDIASRPRPDVSLVNAYQVFPDKSFPSLHVVTYTVFFGYILYLATQKIHNKFAKVTLITVSILMIGLVGLSRIYLGAHWFTDVIGGYLLSLVILLVIINLDKRLTKNDKR